MIQSQIASCRLNEPEGVRVPHESVAQALADLSAWHEESNRLNKLWMNATKCLVIQSKVRYPTAGDLRRKDTAKRELEVIGPLLASNERKRQAWAQFTRQPDAALTTT